MNLLTAVPLLFLLADPDPDAGWEQAAKDDGITVYQREKKETGVQEMKANGTFNASPLEVWKVLGNYDAYKDFMPVTEISKIVATEDDGKVIFFYSKLKLPFVDKRDYILRIVDESDWQDGKGYLKSTWKIATHEKGPPETKDVVRVKTNDGYWKLLPADEGKKTFATYYLYTDPGGSVPKWLVNKANGSTIPDVFKSVRKVLAANGGKAPEPKK